jgi:hypothetical protein
MHTPFTAEDIRAILTNPVYTGIGPFQAIVGEETWLDVNVAIIAEEGAPETIWRVLAQFEGSFPDAPNLDAGAYVRQASIAPRDALHRLLSDMHRVAEAPCDQEYINAFLRIIAQVIRRSKR